MVTKVSRPAPAHKMPSGGMMAGKEHPKGMPPKEMPMKPMMAPKDMMISGKMPPKGMPIKGKKK